MDLEADTRQLLEAAHKQALELAAGLYRRAGVGKPAEHFVADILHILRLDQDMLHQLEAGHQGLHWHHPQTHTLAQHMRASSCHLQPLLVRPLVLETFARHTQAVAQRRTARLGIVSGQVVHRVDSLVEELPFFQYLNLL